MTGVLKVLSDTSIRPTLAALGHRTTHGQRVPPLRLLSESLKFSVGRILESDILGIAAMDCNDGSIKDFVGYKYPTYAC